MIFNEAYWFGVCIGYFLCYYNHIRPRAPTVTLVVTPSPRWDIMPPDADTWAKLVEPLVAKCTVGAKFGTGIQWNAAGADAVGYMLSEMARRLDTVLDEKRAKQRA